MANYVISEEGTTNINVSQGSTTISFSENNPNFKVEVYFTPVANAQGSWQQYIISGENLIIRNNVSVGDRNIAQNLIIKDYFKSYGNTEVNYLQSNITADFYYSYVEEITISNLQSKEILVEGALGKNNVIDGTNLEFDNIRYVGGNLNDTITGSPHRPAIYSTGERGSAVVISGDGNDFFDVWYATSDVEIFDKGGDDDRLYIGENRYHGQGWNLFFDVINTETTNEITPLEFKGLVILKDNKILEWFQVEKTPGSISINNWFDSNGDRSYGAIEQITIADGIDATISEDIDEHILKVKERVADWFRENDPSGKYGTAKDALMDRNLSPTLRNELIACYTQETCPIRLIYQEELYPGMNDEIDYWGVQRGEFYGSNGNDIMYATKDSTVKGCAGNDKLYRGNYQEAVRDENGNIIWGNTDYQKTPPKAAIDYKLYGEAGNDVLEAGKGVLVDGGVGSNVIKVGEDVDATIVHSSGKNYIHFTDNSFDEMTFSKEGTDLVIDSQEGTRVVLDDYFKYGAKSSVKGLLDTDSGISVDYEDEYADVITEKVANASTSVHEILANQSQIENNTAPVRNKAVGTVYNDKMDFSEHEVGLTIDGGQGDDELDGTVFKDTIIGGLGDDEITTGEGADNVTGDIGENTIEYNELSHIRGDRITLTKGENLTLDFSTLQDAIIEYKVNGRDVDVTVTQYGQSETLKLLNLATRDITNNATKKDVNSSWVKIRTEHDLEGFDIRSTLLSENKVMKNYNGTWLSEDINAKDYIAKDRYGNEIVNNTRGLIINGAGGDDTITGSKYNDTISGGAGVNTVKYSAGMGQDTINLTKGENFTLEITDVNSFEDVKFEIINGRDLRIYADKDDLANFVTLKNFASRDITNNSNARLNIEDSSSVELKICDETYDLRNFVDEYNNPLYLTEINKNYNGTWLTEYIDAQSYERYVDRAKTIVDDNYKNKGLTINGQAGNDYIDGSNYSDTILGGTGDDSIDGYYGNDIITGGAGKNEVYYRVGDGNDVINLTKGENFTLILEDIDNINDLKFEFVNGRDLRIYTDSEYTTNTDEYITLKNFASRDITNNSNARLNIEDSSSVKLQLGANPAFELREYLFNLDVKKNYTGTWLDENINAEDYEAFDRYGTPILNNTKGLVINGAGGDDTITGSRYYDTITGGAGENTVYYTISRGQDTINLTKGETLNLYIADSMGVEIAQSDLEFAPAKNKLDLEVTIAGDPDSKIILKNYYGRETGATVIINGMDLAKIDYSKFGVDSEHFENTAIFNGSALSDVVNASGLQNPKNPRNNTGVTINGNGGDDEIIGTEFKDTIRGGSGVDVIEAGAEADTVYGDNDKDYINGGDGNDKIYGGNGNDIIEGSDGADTIDGGNDSDTIYGGIGIDKLYGGNGNDIIYTNEGDYESFDGIYYYADAGSELVKAGAGSDTIYLESYEVDAYGEAGDDTYNIKAYEADIVDSAGSDKYNIDKSFDVEIVDNSGNDEYKILGANELDLEAAEIEITDKNGDDIYRINPGDYVDIEINEAKGSDTYEVSDLANVFVEITDKNGNDNIVLTHDSKDDVTLLFDVKVDRYGRAITPVNKELVILDNSEINNFLYSPEGSYTGIVVENYFGSNASKIETITDKYGATLNTASIEAIRQNVAAWLVANDYSSSLEAFLDKDTNADTLLAMYQNANWQDPSLI